MANKPSSLPHRQLRKHPQPTVTGALCSLPHRQLRNRRRLPGSPLSPGVQPQDMQSVPSNNGHKNPGLSRAHISPSSLNPPFPPVRFNTKVITAITNRNFRQTIYASFPPTQFTHPPRQDDGGGLGDCLSILHLCVIGIYRSIRIKVNYRT